MPRTARSGGVSGMLHRTTVRRADLIEGTVDSLVRNRGRIRPRTAYSRAQTRAVHSLQRLQLTDHSRDQPDVRRKK
jgi:hypothetical protein